MSTGLEGSGARTRTTRGLAQGESDDRSQGEPGQAGWDLLSSSAKDEDEEGNSDGSNISKDENTDEVADEELGSLGLKKQHTVRTMTKKNNHGIQNSSNPYQDEHLQVAGRSLNELKHDNCTKSFAEIMH